MKVAIVHYHFRLSGVTQVITEASRALKALEVGHVILVDEVPTGEEFKDLPLRAVAGLGYDATDDVVEVLKRLRLTAKDVLGAAPDLWHFHNHSIGKNSLMHEVVAQLAEAGEKLVLHLHDLAEDGRQQNYANILKPERLYPVSGNIHYVFLNEHDRGVFTQRGLPEDRSSVILNPVVLPVGRENKAKGDPVLFAPVRAIRRKNIGELVLLAALAPGGTRIAVSRAPEDKQAFALHETWRKFAAYERLPIGFDVVGRYQPATGAASDYQSWIEHCSHFVTTSVSEGFGMTFLEAAANGKPLIGRNIPRVTSEHTKRKISSGNLYDKLLVPIEWVDISILRQHFDTTIERNYRYLGRKLEKDTIVRAFASLQHDGWLDYGNMPEPVQQAVVERLADTSLKKIAKVVIDGKSRSCREWLEEVLKETKNPVKLKQLEIYQPKAHGEAISKTYEQLLKQEPGELKFLNATAILDAHLVPENFHFLTSVIPPRPTTWGQYRAVIFDIYGTLLIAPQIGIAEPNPRMDGLMQVIIEHHGYFPPDSPTQALHDAIMRHHEASEEEYPEVDMREIWREVLGLGPNEDLTNLVNAIEGECRPCQPMPGAAEFIRRLAHSGVSLGLLSNGQCNTLRSLGGIRDFFAPELTLISYQHGIAKPSKRLFELLAERLACRGIAPADALYIGNDPLKDIVPAAACGFKTALFTGHPDSYRPGNCTPDHEIPGWPQTKGLKRC